MLSQPLAQVTVLGSLSRFEGVILETVLTDVFRVPRIVMGEMPEDVVTRIVLRLPMDDPEQFFREYPRWWERLIEFLGEMARRRGKHGFALRLELLVHGRIKRYAYSGRNWRDVTVAFLDLPGAVAHFESSAFVYAEGGPWQPAEESK